MKRADLTTEYVLGVVEGWGRDAFDHLRREGVPAKLILAAFAREERAGRLESGVSDARPWLTPAGGGFIA